MSDKHVISFSVYGNNPKYTIGMLRNIELSNDVYPGWKVYVYYNNSVPQEFIDQYSKYDNVVTKDMTGTEYPGMFWRFLPDADVFISRDADSRLSIREKLAVDEWLFSGKKFHILRDNPQHGIKILGGMFGMRKCEVQMIPTIQHYLKETPNNWDYGVDQTFLRGIYEYFKGTNQVLEHDSMAFFPDTKPFPTPLDSEFHFVGEIFGADDIRENHWTSWLNHKEIRS